jgi:hypothetical protein
MDVLFQLSNQVQSIRSHESLTGLLKTRLATEKKEGFFPDNYYFVTHLTNPANAYWSKKCPEVQMSNDLLRKLNLGKRLENMAGFWFRGLPDFLTEQGVLDGAIVAIPRVRGSIDFRVGENIIEFKTKDELPASVEDLKRKYPQDIEQLAFYSVLDTLKSKENYLVFMNSSPPYELKAFKVVTKDFGKIKNLLMSRIKLLDEAITNDDYSKLGKCRYFSEQCQYEEQGACACVEASSLSTQESLNLKSLFPVLYGGSM